MALRSILLSPPSKVQTISHNRGKVLFGTYRQVLLLVVVLVEALVVVLVCVDFV